MPSAKISAACAAALDLLERDPAPLVARSPAADCEANRVHRGDRFARAVARRRSPEIVIERNKL